MHESEDSVRGATWAAVVVLGVAALGCAVGYLILFVGHPSEETAGLVEFKDSGDYALWLLLAIGQVGLWAVLAFALVPTLRELKSKKLRMRRPVALGLSFFGVLVVLMLVGTAVGADIGGNFDNPWPNHELRLTLIAALGAAVAAFATVCMGLVYEWLAIMDAKTDAMVDVDKATVTEFVRLRLVLHRLLEVQATILGSAILSVAALRGAILAVEGLSFPQELLIGYGLAGSAALVLVYAPVYASVLAAGRRLMDKATPFPDVTGTDWPDAIDRRAKLESVLRIDSSVATNIQAVLAILTPLVGSVLGVIVGVE